MTNTIKTMVRTLLIATCILLCSHVSNAQVLRGLNLMLVDTTGGTRDTTIMLPSPSATSYSLTLPPNGGTQGALLLINSTSGSTSQSNWLPLGAVGEMLTVNGSGMPQWSAANTLPFWGLSGNMGTSPLTNFLGTRDAQPLVIRTDSLERMRILPTGEIGIGTTTVDANYLVDVNGALIVGNQLDDVGNRQTGENAMLVAHKTTTTTQVSMGLHTILSLDPASASNQLGLGVYNNIDIAAGNSQNFTGAVIAVASQAAHLGTGNVSNMFGTYSNGFNKGSGFVNNLIGMQGLAQNQSTTGGTVNQLIGVAGQASQFPSGGTANVAVSVWAQPASGGSSFNASLMVGQQLPVGYLGSVTDVAFIVNDANRPSTINGALGIGTMPAASSLFHVNGTPGTANVRMASLAADGAAFAPATDGLVIADNNGDLRRTSVASVVAANAWAITGNAGTDPLLNFIGTSDAQALVIRTDDTERLRITETGAITQTGTGQVTFTGNVDATNGLDVTTANLTVGGTNFTVAPATGNTSIAGTLGVTGATTLSSTLNQTGNAVIASTAGSSTTIGNATGAITLSGTALTPNVTVSNLGGTAKTSIGVGFDRIVLANNAGLLEEASIGSVLASAGWALTGNNGTTPTNFLGTTDSVSLRLRTSNTERLIIDSVGRVGIGTTTPAYTLDVAGVLNQTVTLTSGRTTTVHSGNNVLGAGVEGVGLATESTGGTVSYVLAGDGTSIGGSVNQTSIGITDLTSNSSQAIAAVDANGKFGFSIGRNDATTYAGTDWATDTVRTVVNNGILGNTKFEVSSGKIMLNPYDGVSAHFFSINPTNITSDKYPNSRDNTGTETPINFLYTNASGVFQSAPLSSITNNAWSITGNAGTTTTNFLGTTDSVSLRLRTANTERLIIDSVGKVGIGTTAPTNQFHVIASSNPVRFEGLQSGALTDSVVTADATGVLGQRSIASLISNSGWALVGNATSSAWNGTTGSFLGTTSAQPLSIATTNATAQDIVLFTGAAGANERLRITGAGAITQTGTGVVTFTGNVDATNGLDVTTANLTVGGTNFTVAPATGNTSIAGTLGVTGATTLSSTLSQTGNAVIASTAGSTTTIGNATGAITLSGTALTPNVTVSNLGGTAKTTIASGFDRIVLADNTGLLEEATIGTVIGSNAWSLTGNTGTSTTNFLGTTDSVSLRLRTANTERLIIDSVGRVGINVSNPVLQLEVNGSFSASHQLINGAQAGIFSQDSIGGAAMSGTATEYIALSGTTARSFVGDRDYYGTQILEAGFEILDSVPGLFSEFKVRRGDPGVHQTSLTVADTIAGKVTVTTWDVESMISQVSDVSGSGSLTTISISLGGGILLQDSQGRYTITDVPDGSITDSLLAIGVAGDIHKLSPSALVSTTAWSLTGNTGTSSTNFLGTTDSVSLRLRTANTERLIIDSVGRVGIGTSAPTNTLHVNASANPVRFEGVQTGDAKDVVLTADSTGVVKKQAMQALNASLARKHNVKRVDADYIIDDEDEYIICVGNTDLDITIPDASVSSGRLLTIVNMTQDARDVYLVQTVGGAANIAFTGLFATPDTFDYLNRIGTVSFSTGSLGGVIGNKVTMISDGIEWFVVGN